MPPDEPGSTPALHEACGHEDVPPIAADDVQRLRAQIRKLVLMKETGPKSAAWQRARVQMIWRLHRKLDQHAASAATNASFDQAQQGQQPKAEDDRA